MSVTRALIQLIEHALVTRHVRSRENTGPERVSQSPMPVAVRPPVSAPSGIKQYYQTKIEVAELTINTKTQNLRRLEAQRNALNARGALRLLDIGLVLVTHGWRSGCSSFAEGRAATAPRTGQLRWRSRQGHGEEQSLGQGPARGQIQCVLRCPVGQRRHASLQLSMSTPKSSCPPLLQTYVWPSVRTRIPSTKSCRTKWIHSFPL